MEFGPQTDPNSSPASIYIYSCVKREYVVYLSLVQRLWWGNVVKFSPQRVDFTYFLRVLCLDEMVCLMTVDLWWDETSHGNIRRKTAQFIWLYSHRLSRSWGIGICILCSQCQHRLPGTAALLGRALWWVENQMNTEELLITADRQMGFWRTTRGLSTLVKICLNREYLAVSLTPFRHVNKLFMLFWHVSS